MCIISLTEITVMSDVLATIKALGSRLVGWCLSHGCTGSGEGWTLSSTWSCI